MGKIEEPLEKVIFLSQHIDEDKRKEEELLQVSNTDRLTGLYNRHAYYSMIAELERKGLSSSLWYISMNINGIKRINESMGHQAGDELITGAAACMKETFGNNHQIFRMGGDEFVTLIEASESQLDELIDKLNKKIGSWKGTLTSNLSISTGIVCAVEFENCTISMMERESDRRMYDQKRAYYSENQLEDRRNREKRL